MYVRKYVFAGNRLGAVGDVWCASSSSKCNAFIVLALNWLVVCLVSLLATLTTHIQTNTLAHNATLTSRRKVGDSRLLWQSFEWSAGASAEGNCWQTQMKFQCQRRCGILTCVRRRFHDSNANFVNDDQRGDRAAANNVHYVSGVAHCSRRCGSHTLHCLVAYKCLVRCYCYFQILSHCCRALSMNVVVCKYE